MSDLPVPVVSPPAIPTPQTLVCANCHAPLNGEYCAACGQRHEPHIHTVAHFAGEAFESISHADSRLWRTLWYLFSRPAYLTREFFAGRRVAYLPPFRLYLVLSVIFFLLAGLSSGEPEEVAAVARIPATASSQQQESAAAAKAALDAAKPAIDAALKQQEQAGVKLPVTDGGPVQVKVDGFSEFCAAFEKPDAGGSGAIWRRNIRQFCHRVESDPSELFTALGHNLPKAMFLFLPLFAGFMKLMYWRPKRYYVEHLLFLVHNHACVFLVLSLFMLLDLLVQPLIGDSVWLIYVSGSLYVIWYIYRAMRNMYGQHGAVTFLKYVLLGWTYVLTAFFTLLLTVIFLALMA